MPHIKVASIGIRRTSEGVCQSDTNPTSGGQLNKGQTEVRSLGQGPVQQHGELRALSDYEGRRPAKELA